MTEAGLPNNPADASSSRRIFRLGRWLVIGALVVLLLWRWLPLRPLLPHKGDGEFADVTVRGKVCVPCGPSLWDFRAYSVTFPDFDLTADHRAEYTVAGLPEIGRDCMLYLAIDDPVAEWMARDEKIRPLRAHLLMEIVREDGEVIRRGEGALGQWTWGFSDGKHRLYQLSSLLQFPPSHAEAYTFRVSYTGDQTLAGLRGYCYLLCRQR